jgi:hypothetical protein
MVAEPSYDVECDLPVVLAGQVAMLPEAHYPERRTPIGPGCIPTLERGKRPGSKSMFSLSSVKLYFRMMELLFITAGPSRKLCAGGGGG